MSDVLIREGKILKIIKLREGAYLYDLEGKNNFFKITNQIDSFNHTKTKISI